MKYIIKHTDQGGEYVTQKKKRNRIYVHGMK